METDTGMERDAEGRAYILRPAVQNAALLLLIYILFVAARYLLATLTHLYPTIVIDELLYYDIAKSIAAGKGILFLGQPAYYTSFLYPLALSPVYAVFPEGTNYMRVFQLWNALLMNLSLFPAYALAREMTGSRARAFTAGVLVLLLPDMLLSGMFMSESILYPLFYCAMLCGYRFVRKRRARALALTGFLGGLLFFTKPGAVAAPAVILLFALASGIRRRKAREIGKALVGVGALAATVGLGYLILSRVFGCSASPMGLYDTQASARSSRRIDLLFRAIALSPYCFNLCGGVCCLAALYRLRRYSRQDQLWFRVVLVALAAMMIGTAWAVNRTEEGNDAVHTRYFAMYIPLLLMFCLIPAEDDQQAKKAASAPAYGDPPVPPESAAAVIPSPGAASPDSALRIPSSPGQTGTDGPAPQSESPGAQEAASCVPEGDPPGDDPGDDAQARQGRTRGIRQWSAVRALSGLADTQPWVIVLALYLMVCSVLFGCKAGIKTGATPIFNLGLSFVRPLSGIGISVVSGMTAIGTLVFVLLLPRMRDRTLRSVSAWVLALLALTSNVMGYMDYSTRNENLVKNNQTVSQLMGDSEPIFVTESTTHLYHQYLCVNTPRIIQTIHLSDLADHARTDGGVYRPFVPTTQRGTQPANLTPDTDLLLIDWKAFRRMKLTDSAEVLTPKGSILHAVRITRGEPWIQGLITGTSSRDELKAGEQCQIQFFCGVPLSGGFTLRVNVRAEEAAGLRVAAAGSEIGVIQLTEGRRDYSISVPGPVSSVTLSPEGADIRLYSYDVTADPGES